MIFCKTDNLARIKGEAESPLHVSCNLASDKRNVRSCPAPSRTRFTECVEDVRGRWPGTATSPVARRPAKNASSAHANIDWEDRWPNSRMHSNRWLLQ